jgi:chemotaxis protein CheD
MGVMTQAAVLASSSLDRLSTLRTRVHREFEARTYFHDPAFGVETVKLMPGEYYVHAGDDLLLTTVLGSCVAACLVDRSIGLSGMNHFMLPEGGSAGRYGVFAMELLINEMMKRGARRERLQAKIFGGGQVMRNYTCMNVGERNVEFVEQFLATERIAIVSKDVLDVCPRKVCLFPGSGRALIKRLAVTQSDVIATVESDYRGKLSRQPAAAASGGVELF